MKKEELALQKYPIEIKGDGQTTSTSDYDFGMDVNLECREAFIHGYESKEAEDKDKMFTLEDMIGLVEHVRYEDFSGKTYESIAKNYIQSLPSPPKQ